MATYNKKLKTLEIHKLLDGGMSRVVDTADDPQASMVLAQFVDYKDLVWTVTQGSTTMTKSIPYHAVQYIKVTETDTEVTKADPYGCE